VRRVGRAQTSAEYFSARWRPFAFIGGKKEDIESAQWWAQLNPNGWRNRCLRVSPRRFMKEPHPMAKNSSSIERTHPLDMGGKLCPRGANLQLSSHQVATKPATIVPASRLVSRLWGLTGGIVKTRQHARIVGLLVAVIAPYVSCVPPARIPWCGRVITILELPNKTDL